MNASNPCLRSAALPLGLLLSVAGVDAAPVIADHLRIELVSEQPALVPGQVAWLGLHLQHDLHWHTYWINPGDSGLPTRLRWRLPDGYTAEPISWPAPSRFEVGGLYNFGFAGDQLLPVAIHVPADAKIGANVVLEARAEWLICREECITGSADLRIELPIAPGVAPPSAAHGALFSRARARLPVDAGWNASARMDGEFVEIHLAGPAIPPTEGLDVFAVERRILDNAPAIVHRNRNALLIRARRSDYFDVARTEMTLVVTSPMTNGGIAAWSTRVPFIEPAFTE